ncbi:competence protein [Pseudalgibacter alginicilyticus]|uniref:Competence protein n=1 Tax=Pseudalgibacter alginicilyticus TaxID=1736674 RepID=A0A0P0DAT4_9FLAO|nr:ComEC/Rec2 family competence protein [Pseudalgibacter alginicilyticus]ALJ05169.1 competence protein [Pseudalgibacter alginicilyticus]
MRLLNFTIIKLTFFLVTGILIGYFFNISANTSIAITGIFFLILCGCFLFAKKQFVKTIWFGIAAYLTMISIGILTETFHNEKNHPIHFTHQIANETDLLKTVTFKIREVLKPNNYYEKYVVTILNIDGKNTSGKSLLNIKKDSTQPTLNVDATFISKAVFKDISPPLNPNQFDYKNYLKKKQIYSQLSLTKTSLYKVENPVNTTYGIANTIRSHINSKLKTYPFKPDELAVINALLLGQRQDISETVYSNYVNAGVIHILALSGLHIGIILLILNRIFKPIEHFKHGHIVKGVLMVIILWSFAIIAGLSPSITRAVTMFSIVAIAINLKRPTNIYNTLAISIFIILLFKPLFLFDVGFQLSYMAVFAIVSIVPYCTKLWKPKNKLIRIYWETLSVTMAAQLGIIPITLYYFNQFPSLFFISNLVIVPFLGFILFYGITVIILALIGILPNIVATIYGSIISSMTNFVSWISNMKTFLFEEISFNFLYLLTSYFVIITLVHLILKRNYSSLRLFLIAILIFQGIAIFTNYSKPTNEFIVFHKSKHTLLGNNKKHHLIIASDIDSISKTNNTIEDYKIGNFINHIEETSIKSVYLLNNKKLLVIDSLGVYNLNTFQPDYVLLRQSPKINLNRLIDSLKPKQIIADGSNYLSYIKNWENICNKRKIPFHETGKMGAYIINYNF